MPGAGQAHGCSIVKRGTSSSSDHIQRKVTRRIHYAEIGKDDPMRHRGQPLCDFMCSNRRTECSLLGWMS
jgi:hypothetical protein